MNLPTAKIKRVLVEKYKHSEYGRKAWFKIREFSTLVSNSERD